MADSAHMESTSEEKREILRKFKIAKKTSPGHSDCTEIKKTRVRTRVQITSNKKYSYTILKIRKSQLGKGSTYIWQINQTPGNTNVRDRYLSFAPWDVRSVLMLYQCLPSWLHVHCLTSVNSFHNVVISVCPLLSNNLYFDSAITICVNTVLLHDILQEKNNKTIQQLKVLGAPTYVQPPFFSLWHASLQNHRKTP